jgi:uncharacterized protein (TIGR02452 family)
MKDTSKPEGSKPSKPKGTSDAGRKERRAIAKSTLEIIEAGNYTVEGVEHDIRPQLDAMLSGTRYYAPDSLLSLWPQPTPTSNFAREKATEISIVEISTLEGANFLASIPYTSPEETRRKVGVLNFASAKNPGGGFQSGAQAQEESIARSSTLYPSLTCSTGEKFYGPSQQGSQGRLLLPRHDILPGRHRLSHRLRKIRRTDQIDVVTSAAVNAGVARRALNGQVAGEAEEVKIGKVMKERMGRILFLFEKHGMPRTLYWAVSGRACFKTKFPSSQPFGRSY